MGSAKVLLVDDERDFTDVLGERLGDRGFDVDSAEDGQSAVEKIDKAFYDAVFLDLAMPGMDGVETLKRLLEKNPDLQIYLLTGQATLQKGVEAIKFGAKDVLEKPVDIKKLVEKIKEAKSEKMVLMQSSFENKISDILKSKGW